MESDPRGRSSRALIYTLCEKGGRFFRPLPVAAKALQPEARQATVILPQCQGQLADSQRGAWRRPLGTGNVGTGNAPHPARVLPTESSGPQGTCCSPCTSTPAVFSPKKVQPKFHNEEKLDKSRMWNIPQSRKLDEKNF